ncbi:MAG TPA: lipopolysaccharide assembly protein LapA domain-containing protein [Mycobacterium sp.]|jgi:uncharacterized integral membrane protein|nr:lipopolysaccharide assembly protein LapA domain-containing protein [Mycobacterium sp.]
MTSDPSVSPDQPSDATPAPAEPPTVTTTPPTKPSTPESAVKFTRAAALWSAMIAGFVILILLLVFIMQNTESTTIHLFGWAWNLPVGVAILLAAVCGGLLTVAAGTSRIIQLRSAAKRNLKAGL